MPIVSVLTPTYRQARFIGDCIRSVLAQTESDWEMVIVDDGSDDGTPDIAESFGDPRIVVLRRPHEGVAGLGRAYALAVARSKGTFLAVLEGDDKWPTTKLAEQLPLFRHATTVLTYGSAGLMDEHGCIYARYWHAPRGNVGNNSPVGIILPSLVKVNFIVAATVMLRRDALDRVGGFFQPNGIPYVDHPTWLRLATTGTFVRSSSILGYWRRYASQVTTRSWFDRPLDRAEYLQSVTDQARHLVGADVLASLEAAARRDESRQCDEGLLARGRVALLEGDWRQAGQLFALLLRRGEPRTRLVATFGLACAVSRTDMERVIAAMGRHSLPSRRHLTSQEHSCATRSVGVNHFLPEPDFRDR